MSFLTSTVVAVVLGYLGGIYLALAYIYMRNVVRGPNMPQESGRLTLGAPRRQELNRTLLNAALVLVTAVTAFLVWFLRAQSMSFDVRYALGGMLLGLIGGFGIFRIATLRGRRKR